MIRNRCLARFVVALAGVVAVGGLVVAAAAAQPTPQTAAGDLLDPRTHDPSSRLFLVLHAEGFQKYTCSAGGAWVFTDPEATLFKTTGKSKPVGTHFLNFATGRPVWELGGGDSSVEASRTQSASGGAGNIPWLLLQAVDTSPGRLGNTTWVQRLNTSGGVAPAGTCTPGTTIAVPYTADYFFWR